MLFERMSYCFDYTVINITRCYWTTDAKATKATVKVESHTCMTLVVAMWLSILYFRNDDSLWFRYSYSIPRMLQ